MNRQLHFRQTEESKVYFSSDFHFFHNPKWAVPLWKSRGFNSAVEMTDGIIESINDTVRSTDKLFFLGDFCLNTVKSQFEELLSRINCQSIYCLYGNHNSCIWSNYEEQVYSQYGKKDIEIYPLYYRNLIYIGNYAEISVDGQYINIFHYPQYIFNHMKDSAWNLVGHSHGNCPFSQPSDTTSKVLDVGWDVFKKPVGMEEIRKIMNTKNVFKVDHHK